MFAVVETGGKQYKIEPGSVLKVEKLEGNEGDTIELGRVILVSDEKGTNTNAEAVKVKAEILRQMKADKVLIFKKKRRHNYRRKNGHRQQLSLVRITDIGGVAAPAREKKAAAPKAEKAAKSETAKKAAPKKAAKKAAE